MFLGKTVYHYNRLMVTGIGMKLSTHIYYITSMTLDWFPWEPQQQTASDTFLYNHFFTSQTCQL